MIVSGIAEAPNGSEKEKAAHYKTSVEALLTALETPLYEMKSHKRIKTNNEKPNLILIEFHRFDSADMVAESLSNAKKAENERNVQRRLHKQGHDESRTNHREAS
jgi:hypothetical protein